MPDPEFKSGAGIINEDRLRRILLSSQPLCFNLFGYLSKVDKNALLPWVRTYAPRATSISRIWLEYAPTAEDLGGDPLGGSAFDAFVEYLLPDESRGFIGIETKYHENLAKGLNMGLRIDLIMASNALKDKVTETGIDYELRGIEKPSDHAPIWTCFA